MLDIITVVYNQANATERLYNSIDVEFTFHLFLHSQRPEVIKTCEAIAQNSNVIYYPYGKNRGLSLSWNDGIKSSKLPALIVNNDIEFAPGVIDKMLYFANAHPDYYLISCGHGYSAFLLQSVAIDKVGYFDEAIKPAYFEDCDYAYRAKLAGVHSIDLPDLGVTHAVNGTIKNERKSYMKKYRHDMARLRDYYKRKWGGGPFLEPDKEIYTRPFNATT